MISWLQPFFENTTPNEIRDAAFDIDLSTAECKQLLTMIDQGKLKGYHADVLLYKEKCMDDKKFLHEYSLKNDDEIKVLAFHKKPSNW